MTDSTTPGGPLRVVFLVPGGEEHGVTRYAGVLSTGLASAGVQVERRVAAGVGLRAIVVAAWGSRAADVVHLQLTKDYWGAGYRQLRNVVALRLVLVGRRVVVTAHDFHTPRRRGGGLRGVWRRVRSPQFPYEAATRVLVGTADLTLTCTRREADTLSWARPRRTAVVAHYVESRPAIAQIRSRVPHATEGPLVVLGYVHRRKGQHWAVRALVHLPGRELVIAGSATARNRAYLDEVLEEASDLGVRGRVRVTGYLTDEDLDRELAVAAVAIAPYARIAASGSIATLVAGGVPLVARSDPYLTELAAACPSAIHLYEEDDPLSIARAIEKCLAARSDDQRRELAAWARQHHPDRTGEQHLGLYRALLSRRRARPGAAS